MKKKSLKRAKMPTAIALLICLAIIFVKPAGNKTTVLPEYSFRSEELLEEHFEKHGLEMGFDNKEEYLEAANQVVQNPNSLHKPEAEDGDDVYYLEDTNEFVIVSKDGYIRTYFLPDAGIDYYNRQ